MFLRMIFGLSAVVGIAYKLGILPTVGA